MAKIAESPTARFNAWILKTWKVLPTNPDFINLTSEQREWLWEDYLIDNPELKRKIESLSDEDYEKDDLDVYESTIGTKVAEEFDDEKDGIKRSEEAQRILDQIDNNLESKNETEKIKDMDWEEIDEFEEDDDWEEVED